MQPAARLPIPVPVTASARLLLSPLLVLTLAACGGGSEESAAPSGCPDVGDTTVATPEAAAAHGTASAHAPSTGTPAPSAQDRVAAEQDDLVRRLEQAEAGLADAVASTVADSAARPLGAHAAARPTVVTLALPRAEGAAPPPVVPERALTVVPASVSAQEAVAAATRAVQAAHQAVAAAKALEAAERARAQADDAVAAARRALAQAHLVATTGAGSLPSAAPETASPSATVLASSQDAPEAGHDGASAPATAGADTAPPATESAAATPSCPPAPAGGSHGKAAGGKAAGGSHGKPAGAAKKAAH